MSSGVVHKYASVNSAARAHGIARGTIFRMIRDGIPRRGLLVRQVTCAARPARTPTVQIERVSSGEVFEYASERAAANAHGIPAGSFYKMVRTVPASTCRCLLLPPSVAGPCRHYTGAATAVLTLLVLAGVRCARQGNTRARAPLLAISAVQASDSSARPCLASSSLFPLFALSLSLIFSYFLSPLLDPQTSPSLHVPI